jgi:hypothetical protein
MSAFFSVVLLYVDRGLATGRSPVQGVLSKYLKGFVVSQVNSDSGKVTGPNPGKKQSKYKGEIREKWRQLYNEEFNYLYYIVLHFSSSSCLDGLSNLMAYLLVTKPLYLSHEQLSG